MLKYLFLIPTAHAQEFPTSTTWGADLNTWTSSAITYFFDLLWTPLGYIITATLILALVGMLWRRLRGMARRPH